MNDANTGDRTYRALQQKAKTTGRNTQELFDLYLLEGFLIRLAASAHREAFVLKGGVLLAAFGNRRPTRDVDLAAIDVSNESENILGLIRAILAVPADDGLTFQLNSLTAEVIRDDSEYSGIRVSAKATLSRAKLSFHVDVNVGDPIYPEPTTVAVPRLLDGDPITVRGYPLQMVYAEKIITAVQRGTASTRWRDFGDIWTLTHHHPITGSDLQGAIQAVAVFRQATIIPLSEALDGYPTIGQAKWAAWRRRTDNRVLPEQFEEVVATVIAFSDPALSGLVTGQVWDQHQRSWVRR
ncbi:nucleotidyl transferase AbiEii/AbiGii toxin family protein [Nocardia altamirensis]|uniref:nucleotidyl transferase AbiEii/AbiGii toxin family protein n=1 Tax=Nocardia altamirensis TaxID=472158 RepID=UPI0009FF08A3|nr:nucleotidyl transferase AbiEii/AbiGii toxin family protein [Nocardia altamirensis]